MRPHLGGRWQVITSAFVALCMTLMPLSVSAEGTEPFEGFEKYVEDGMKVNQCPGLAIVIVKDDKVIYAKGFGYRKLGSPEKVDERTLFPIASVTKQLTSALIATLVDEGKMQWDGKVVDYLPWFELNDPFATRELTVRDLLLHRSGLPPTNWQWYGGPMKSDEILHRIKHQPLTVGFRQKHMYQNVGYLAVGTCAAAAGGDTFENLLKKRLFDPLQMYDTSTSTKNLPNLKNVAQPHEMIDGKLVPVKFRNLDEIVPAGGVISNVMDMAQWLKLELANGKLGDKQIINPDRMKEMHEYGIFVTPSATMQAAMPDELTYFGYGMGIYTHFLRGNRVYRHSGGIDGIATTCGFLPDKHIGICILSNGDANTVMGTFYRLNDFYSGVEPRDWMTIVTKAYNETDGKWLDEHPKSRWDNQIQGTRPSLALERYCGKYTNGVYGDVEIRLENGKLVFDFGPERIADLEHHHFDTFKSHWRSYIASPDPRLVTFYIDGQGNITELELDEIDKFKRQP